MTKDILPSAGRVSLYSIELTSRQQSRRVIHYSQFMLQHLGWEVSIEECGWEEFRFSLENDRCCYRSRAYYTSWAESCDAAIIWVNEWLARKALISVFAELCDRGKLDPLEYKLFLDCLTRSPL